MFAAFGRETKATLEARLPADIYVTTWNSFGFKVLRRSLRFVSIEKFVEFQWAAQQVGKGRKRKPARDFVVGLLSAAKATISMPDDLDLLADTWDLPVPKGCDRAELIGATSRILEAQLESPHNPICFDDQCWMPIVHGLEIPRYDLVGVDETQDLNPVQLELLVRSADRAVAVGDPRQSIFAWRGADPQAMPNMVRRLDALQLPLLTCYRCGTEIIREACTIYPVIKAPPGQRTGSVQYASWARLVDQAAPGDFVVSRLNAPLIRLCLRWMALGKRSKILGRDVAAGLVRWVEHFECSDIAQLLGAIQDYEAKELERLESIDQPTEQLTDRCAAIRAVSEGLRTTADLIKKLQGLFADSAQHGYVTLASTHRAKGLEADRVWLLRDTYCRRWMSADYADRKGLEVIERRGNGACVHDPHGASVEDRNLLYVAVTRAKNELIYVKGLEE